ncbi:hypothetical protein LUZ60_009853 [Juncus effusus]|nr:hypothetical protein LUZ60_009853 [Juncus effusus]
MKLEFMNLPQIRVKILKLVLLLASFVFLILCINFLKGPQENLTLLTCKEQEVNKPVIQEVDKPVVQEIDKPVLKDIDKPVLKEVDKLVFQDAKKSHVPSFCDFSDGRSDVCDMQGDVRIHGTSTSILFVRQKRSEGSQDDQIVRIRPYPRKFDTALLETIGDVRITPSTDPRYPYICRVNHTIPAVVFSLGGFLGNYYHDFSDILIPLFITSHQFKGEVQFLIMNMNPWWVGKYKEILSKLSNYDIIDLKIEHRIHCYPRIIVNLHSHKKINIDPSRAPNNESMVDFVKFLRTSYSLERNSTDISHRKPKLLIITRTFTRLLVNVKEIISMAEGLGFEVVAQDSSPEVADFARIVYSCDVMIGVYGAGLTNLVFLPDNAVFIQIAPLGKPSAREDFGVAAIDRKLNYIHYAINVNESTLLDTYARDDPVFTDPDSIHRQGYPVSFYTYLVKQNMKINITRFRPVLEQALELIRKQ